MGLDKKSDLKAGTEAVIFAAQEQALRTNYVEFHVEKTVESPLCRMCNEKGESVGHFVSECSKLAQREYKRRHDNVARIIHWELCRLYEFGRADKWLDTNGTVYKKQTELKCYGISAYNATM